MTFIPEIVYALCAFTSTVCAALLIRAYARHRMVLLLWSSICFGGIAIGSALLFVDLAVVREIDLSGIRALVTAASMIALVIGLIWSSSEGERRL